MSDTPTLLKARALAAASGLLRLHPAGIRFRDIAAALGLECMTEGDKRPLRNALMRLCGDGVLSSGGHGVIVAGSALGDPEAVAPGVAMATKLRKLFEDGGGFVNPADAKVALTVDAAGERALGRAAEACGCVRGLPLRWYRHVWCLSDGERMRFPLPGPWLALDTRFEIRLGGGDWTVESVRAELHARRLEIGVGVQQARESLGLTPEEVLENQAVAEAFARSLDNGRRRHIVVGGAAETLGQWWRGRVERMGLETALAYTWPDLEGDGLKPDNDLVHPIVIDAMSACFWRALGRRLTADPARLSRGRWAA